MRFQLLAVVVILGVWLGAAQISEATYGVDVSQPVDKSAFECMVKSGFDFVIVRGWQSFGAADPNAPDTLKAAKEGGMAHYDTYLFPCAGKSASSQVSGLVSYLASHGAEYGMIWFDIETNPSGGCGWGSASDNCKFLEELIDEAKALKKVPGVYASKYMWDSIMGSSCTIGHDKGAPLWYADYDGSPSFGDFSPFGGWSSPAMKQYDGSGSVCGAGVDKNWYP